MAHHHDIYSKGAALLPALGPDDRLSQPADAPENNNSHFSAFLLGGVVIAGGLMTFLYFDNGQATRDDDMVTGSIMRVAPLSATNVQIPLLPRRAADGDTKP